MDRENPWQRVSPERLEELEPFLAVRLAFFWSVTLNVRSRNAQFVQLLSKSLSEPRLHLVWGIEVERVDALVSNPIRTRRGAGDPDS